MQLPTRDKLVQVRRSALDGMIDKDGCIKVRNERFYAKFSICTSLISVVVSCRYKKDAGQFKELISLMNTYNSPERIQIFFECLEELGFEKTVLDKLHKINLLSN